MANTQLFSPSRRLHCWRGEPPISFKAFTELVECPKCRSWNEGYSECGRWEISFYEHNPNCDGYTVDEEKNPCLVGGPHLEVVCTSCKYVFRADTSDVDLSPREVKEGLVEVGEIRVDKKSAIEKIKRFAHEKGL